MVTGLSNIKVITAGNLFSFAISKDGNVWGWGANTNGELGDGTRINPVSPAW
ncbi:hypothetical protein [Paenibacillus odorifer]|uniref:hypothetical protein n=1 Tax=Paenibacillus odorifer TaxID=189426 RepID=UPI0009D6AE76